MLRLGKERGGRSMVSILDDVRDALSGVPGLGVQLFQGEAAEARLALLFAIAQRDHGCRGFSLEVPGKAFGFDGTCMDILHVSVRNGLIQTYREGLEAWPLFSLNQMICVAAKCWPKISGRLARRRAHADVWAALGWIQAGYALEETLALAEQHQEDADHRVTMSTRRAGRRNRKAGHMRYCHDDLMTRVLTCGLSPLKAVPMEDRPNHSTWAVRTTNSAWSEAKKHLTVKGLVEALHPALVEDNLHPHPLRPLRGVSGAVGDVARCRVL
jgi:hypothetical protein